MYTFVFDILLKKNRIKFSKALHSPETDGELTQSENRDFVCLSPRRYSTERSLCVAKQLHWGLSLTSAT